MERETLVWGLGITTGNPDSEIGNRKSGSSPDTENPARALLKTLASHRVRLVGFAVGAEERGSASPGAKVPGLRVSVRSTLWVAVCLLLAIPLAAKKPKKSPPPPPAAHKSGYDATRDPSRDLQDAMAQATKTNRRILIEVGGDWCVYCGIMDATFDGHPELRKELTDHYVLLKVNYSKENPNDTFLSRYPAISDYPHFFVLDSKGTLVRSQPTHSFEHKKTYNAGKIDDFLKKYSQPPRHWLNKIS